MPLQQRALAEKKGDESRFMSDLTLENAVTISYLGDERVNILSGDRSFEADRRTNLDRPGAGFCPLELVAAALGA
jgi:phage gp46-like protein